MEYCKKCGARMEEGSAVCPVCGYIDSASIQPRENSTKSIILATIAGCLIVFAIVLVVLVATGVISGNNDGGDADALPVATEDPDHVVVEEPDPTPEPTPDPREKKYERAMSHYENKEYKEAYEEFKEIKKYEDSEDWYKRAGYKLAKQYYKKYKYTKAAKIFDELGDYEYSKDYSEKCAVQLFIGQTITAQFKLGKSKKKNQENIKLDWTRVDGAEGYDVKWTKKAPQDDSDDGDSEETSTSRKIVIKGEYKWVRARVRAYKTIGGKKYYTAWSNTAQVKRVKKVIKKTVDEEE